MIILYRPENKNNAIFHRENIRPWQASKCDWLDLTLPKLPKILPKNFF
jgi:hypothetical protein